MEGVMAYLRRSEIGATHLIYAFHFGSQTLVWPFLPLFLMRHMTTFQLGMTLGVCRITQVFAAPAWTFVADARAGRGAVFGGALSVWQFTTFLIPCVARTSSFNMLLLLLVVRSVFEAPLIPLMDAGVLCQLERCGGLFGSRRLWGSLSWGLLAPVGGVLFTRYGFSASVAVAITLSFGTARCATLVLGPTSTTQGASFPYSSVSSSDDDVEGSRRTCESCKKNKKTARSRTSDEESKEEGVIVANLLTCPTCVEEATAEEEDDPASPTATNATWTVKKKEEPVSRFPESLRSASARCHLATFLLCVGTTGSGFGFVMSFLFVFAKSIGGGALLCGMLLFVECAVEIPCLLYADHLRERFGAKRLLVLVQALYALRCAGYATVAVVRPSAWWLLAVEPAHGVTFALFYTSGVVCAKSLIGSDEWASFAQGLFSGAFTAGCGIGAAVGGWAADRFGFVRTFQAFFFIYIASTILFSVALPDDAPKASPGGGAGEAAAAAASGEHHRRPADGDVEDPERPSCCRRKRDDDLERPRCLRKRDDLLVEEGTLPSPPMCYDSPIYPEELETTGSPPPSPSSGSSLQEPPSPVITITN